MRISYVVRPAAGVVFRRLAAEKGAVLLRLSTGAYHSLNETGAVLWEMMDGKRTVTEIATELGRLVEAPPPELAAEVEEFFRDLSVRALVEVAQGETGPEGP